MNLFLKLLKLTVVNFVLAVSHLSAWQFSRSDIAARAQNVINSYQYNPDQMLIGQGLQPGMMGMQNIYCITMNFHK